MNCFVIMPFASEFDDVYATIKGAIESSTTTHNGRCFRLDDARPAGRITDRLLNELRAATFCVADLTGNKPNVMWELGFAMALGKPTIVVTQTLGDLPFDIKDMQSIEYQRHHLSSSLSSPLRRAVMDTLACLTANQPEAKERCVGNAEVVGTLLKEIAQLKEIVAEAVHAWKGNESTAVQSASERQSMCGHWLNTESQSHVYISIVRDELVAPYCYAGNDRLTGVYFGWRRTGDYWFARYQWLEASISGFSFLRRDSVDVLNGAWWSADFGAVAGDAPHDAPPSSAGVPANWVQQKNGEIPIWAEGFFKEVRREGLASYLAKARSSLEAKQGVPKISTTMPVVVDRYSHILTVILKFGQPVDHVEVKVSSLVNTDTKQEIPEISDIVTFAKVDENMIATTWSKDTPEGNYTLSLGLVFSDHELFYIPVDFVVR